MNQPFSDDPTDSDSDKESDLPDKVGRYLVMDLLGEGGFSWVYRAFDMELQRSVALKVLRPQLSRELKLLDKTFVEAQILAGLKRHNSIVQVYDVERTEKDEICIVYELIEGESLAERLARKPATRQEALVWMKEVCHALHHVHKHGLVHRDIKPGNIMLDASGHSVLIDFGLATASELERDHAGGVSGTPSYMSPEQARGENHLVDGRSDIFSLGIVFYELMVGRRPFEGTDERAVLNKIKTQEARPLRLYDDSVPAELERICLRALSPKLGDRYVIALDMAKDLEEFEKDSFSAALAPSIAPTPSTSESNNPTTWDAATETFTLGKAAVVPKGLRAFGVEDKDFFLTLLPGVRNRHGVPESVDYWVSRIHGTSTEAPFRVGLIYGPSGSGKSSFVHGGIVPLLESYVNTISIEGDAALPQNLLKTVWKRFPELEGEKKLPRVFQEIRRYTMPDASGKLLLVIDQFEQWLHANPSAEERQELIQAFRQCDAQNLQAIFLIRDDFWLGISQFMDDLEVEMSPRKNCMFLDLFDHRHAQKVLGKFGRAYGALPPPPDPLSATSEQFLQKAVEELSVEEKVAPVRLALFADMLKVQAWNLDTLRSAGGADGLGVKFLEQAFDKKTSDPAQKQFSKAARKILSELLPSDLGIGIKGSAKSEKHLRAAAGMENKDELFQRLLRMLDQDLRLMTPNDRLEDDEPITGDKSYQLTHDFLVAPIRDWLTKHLLSTRRGRLQVHVENLTRVWRSSQPRVVLPSVWEWAGLSLFSRRRDWGQDARTMMKQAGTRHGLRLLSIGAAVGLLWWSVTHVVTQDRSETYVETLLNAAPEQVESILASNSRRLPGVHAVGRQRLESGNLSHRQELLARILLLPEDPGQSGILAKMLYDEKTGPFEVGVLLANQTNGQLVQEAKRTIIDAERAPAARLRAACAVSAGAIDERIPVVDESDWRTIGLILLKESARAASRWAPLLKTHRENLRGILEQHLEYGVPARQREVAALVLTQFFEGKIDILEELFEKLEPSEVYLVNDAIGLCTNGDKRLNDLMDLAVKSGLGPSDNARKFGNIALARALSGDFDSILPLLRQNDDPSVRTYILHGLGPSGCNRDLIIEALSLPREGEDGAFITSALVLALSEFDDVQLPKEVRDSIQPLLEGWYQDHPFCGVRSASQWLLRQWNKRQFPDEEKQRQSDRDWWITPKGIAMRILEDRNHRFAMSTTEITQGVYQEFEDYLQSPEVYHLWKDTRLEKDSVFLMLTDSAQLSSSRPVTWVYIIQAMIFCNWFSEEEEISAHEMCYPPNEVLIPLVTKEPEGSLELLDDWFGDTANGSTSKTGYRLPVVSEWLYACSGGASSVGSVVEAQAAYSHFDKYGWFADNSNSSNRVGSLIPNPYGFFDMLGNVSEWCHLFQSVAEKPSANSVFKFAITGGAYDSKNENLSSIFNPKIIDRTFRSDSIGFRIARTLSSKP